MGVQDFARQLGTDHGCPRFRPVSGSRAGTGIPGVWCIANKVNNNRIATAGCGVGSNPEQAVRQGVANAPRHHTACFSLRAQAALHALGQTNGYRRVEGHPGSHLPTPRNLLPQYGGSSVNCLRERATQSRARFCRRSRHTHIGAMPDTPY